MPTYTTAKTNGGTLINAKYFEVNGTIIRDNSGNPYKVPADFDWNKFIKKFEAFTTTPLGYEVYPGETFTLQRGLAYSFLIKEFNACAPSDIQRTYNGISTCNGNDFVPEFTPAASLLFGAAVRATNLTYLEALGGGAARNLFAWITEGQKTDISGLFGNTPVNVYNINRGYDLYGNLSASTTSQTTNANGPKFTQAIAADIAEAKDSGIYVVRPDNVLGDIAKKLGCSVPDILKANPDIKNEDLIYPGQKLIIPTPKNTKDPLDGYSFQKDANGNVVSITNPEGKVTNYTYDEKNNMATVTDPDGKVTTISRQYNEQGIVVAKTVTNPDGITTNYQYNANGNVISETNSKGELINYTYDEYGNLLDMQVTEKSGGVSGYQYDASAGKIIITDPNDAVKTNAYDAEGNLLSSSYSDTDGNFYDYAYNAETHTLASVDDNGAITRFQYDDNGNLASKVAADGRTTTYQYDSDNNITATSMTDVNGAVINTGAYVYDQNGNLISNTETQTDADGVVLSSDALTYAYDSDNNMTSSTKTQTYTDGSDTSVCDYDSQENPINSIETQTDASGMIVNTNRVTAAYNENNDCISSVETHTDANGTITNTATWTADYDANDNLISCVGVQTNENGSEISRTTTTYDYDTDNTLIASRETQTNENGRTIIDEQYDDNGQLTDSVSRQFQSDGSLQEVNHTDGSTGVSTIYSYNEQGEITTAYYDAEGNPTEEVIPAGPITDYFDLATYTNGTTPGDSDPNGIPFFEYEQFSRAQWIRDNSESLRGNEQAAMGAAAGGYAKVADSGGVYNYAQQNNAKPPARPLTQVKKI